MKEEKPCVSQLRVTVELGEWAAFMGQRDRPDCGPAAQGHVESR